MYFEVLKKNHLKRNIIIGVIVVAIISTVILNFTRAKYRVTQSIPLVNGTINYSLEDLNTVAIYINGDNGYTQTDIIPESGYVLNEEESYCAINGEEDTSISVSYDVDTKSLSVTPMTTQGTKCYLYFEENPSILLSDAIMLEKNIQTRNDFSDYLRDETTGIIFRSYDETQYDNDGEVYYFAGAPTDNWVKFAKDSSGNDLYWRIVRINGNGSIRLIYNGTSTTTTGTGTQIGTSAFNRYSNNNAYVGYMYTLGSLRGTGTSSTIKQIIDEWYENNLLNYQEYLDVNSGFCGDRRPSTSQSTNNGSGGTGTTTTYYGAYFRIYYNNTTESYKPSFQCNNNSDLYTVNSSNQGNKALVYPIGLITADEVIYAGLMGMGGNTDFYLYTSELYWTMTPYSYSDGSAGVFALEDGFSFANRNVTNTYGIRPVINLNSNVLATGTGTVDDPYLVQTD